MNKNRIERLYGDKPFPSPLFVCLFFFGEGWFFAQKLIAKDFIACSIALLIAIYFLDALCKSIVFVKENYTFEVSLKKK